MLEIAELKVGNVVALELKGRLDSVTAHQLKKIISALIHQGEKRLVVDFARLDYISSFGIGVLLLTAKRLKLVDGRLVLCSLNEHIQKVFDVSRFSSSFRIVDSQQEAIQSCS